jgi:hypothetical protein
MNNTDMKEARDNYQQSESFSTSGKPQDINKQKLREQRRKSSKKPLKEERFILGSICVGINQMENKKERKKRLGFASKMSPPAAHSVLFLLCYNAPLLFFPIAASHGFVLPSFQLLINLLSCSPFSSSCPIMSNAEALSKGCR